MEKRRELVVFKCPKGSTQTDSLSTGKVHVTVVLVRGFWPSPISVVAPHKSPHPDSATVFFNFLVGLRPIMKWLVTN